MKILSFVTCLFCLTLESCFLFPDSKPITGTDSTKVPTPFATFAPSFEWVQPTRGVAMDVFPFGDIISRGVQFVNGNSSPVLQIFSPLGATLIARTSDGSNALIRELFADTEQGGGYRTIELFDLPPTGQNSLLRSGLSFAGFGFETNSYIRYNTALGQPDATPGIWEVSVETVGPNIARGPRQDKQGTAASQPGYQYAPSLWFVGTFTDKFGANGNANLCPTFGKADCFVVRYGEYEPIVHHQWGGSENDIIYGVLGDNVGTATIFLRAGSDFTITSATQSLVKMKVGYNIVRLDTNGLMTETFPVQLNAQGEVARVELARADGNALYISGLDLQRNQYFLAKVSSSGTAWIRYFEGQISTQLTYFYQYFPHLGITNDRQGNVYLTGNFYGKIDLGGQELQTASTAEMFVASYTPNNTLRGALAMGSGVGYVIRLSPEEESLYVSGWGTGPILGVEIPDPNANLPTRDREFRSPAFLVKLRMK